VHLGGRGERYDGEPAGCSPHLGGRHDVAGDVPVVLRSPLRQAAARRSTQPPISTTWAVRSAPGVRRSSNAMVVAGPIPAITAPDEIESVSRSSAAPTRPGRAAACSAQYGGPGGGLRTAARWSATPRRRQRAGRLSGRPAAGPLRRSRLGGRRGRRRS
jgi:hypothetical protein